MDISPFFKSIIDQDRSAVVISDTAHRIIYMNRSAIERYAGYGGASLLGRNLPDCHNEESKRRIYDVVRWFEESPENNIVHTFYNEKENKDVYMVALRDDNNNLIGYYEKHEYRSRDMSVFYDIK